MFCSSPLIHQVLCTDMELTWEQSSWLQWESCTWKYRRTQIDFCLKQISSLLIHKINAEKSGVLHSSLGSRKAWHQPDLWQKADSNLKSTGCSWSFQLELRHICTIIMIISHLFMILITSDWVLTHLWNRSTCSWHVKTDKSPIG